jgi:hypothetical protein
VVAVVTAPLDSLPTAVQRAYRAAGSPELPPLGPTFDKTPSGAETQVLGQNRAVRCYSSAAWRTWAVFPRPRHSWTRPRRSSPSSG